MMVKMIMITMIKTITITMMIMIMITIMIMIMMIRAEETTAGCCALPDPTRDRTKVAVLIFAVSKQGKVKNSINLDFQIKELCKSLEFSDTFRLAIQATTNLKSLDSSRHSDHQSCSSRHWSLQP